MPYLRGVDDPYEADAGSPYERWKRKFSLGRMSSALGGLVRGKLRQIVVTQRGVLAPDRAREAGRQPAGRPRSPGLSCAGALGLPDTWAYFKKKKRRKR